MRHATRHNKRDANEGEIVATFTKLGVSWLEAGPLDGWVWLGMWMPVEIKVPKGRLTKGQKAFIDECAALDRPHCVVRSSEEAVQIVQVYREYYTWHRPEDQNMRTGHCIQNHEGKTFMLTEVPRL